MKKSRNLSLVIITSLSLPGCEAPATPPTQPVCLNSETNVVVESRLCADPQDNTPAATPTGPASSHTSSGVFRSLTHPYYWSYPQPRESRPSQFRRNAQPSRTPSMSPANPSRTTRGGFGSTGRGMSSSGS